jgi:hypothetical protein
MFSTESLLLSNLHSANSMQIYAQSLQSCHDRSDYLLAFAGAFTLKTVPILVPSGLPIPVQASQPFAAEYVPLLPWVMSLKAG